MMSEDDEYGPVYISGEEIDFVGAVERIVAPCSRCDQLRAEVERWQEIAGKYEDRYFAAFAYGERKGREDLQEKFKELIGIKEANDEH